MRTLPYYLLLLVLCVLAGSSTFAQSSSMPEIQQQFLSIIDDFAAKYKAAPNDMAKGALRPQRAQAVCALLTNGQVKDWVGTVEKLSSNNEGKGVLDVSMSKIANATTWNNSLSDFSDETLLTPGTPLHEAAIQLSRGQTIIFSGTFVKGDKDCFRESSITQNGSMTDPDWIFRFSALKLAPSSALGQAATGTRNSTTSAGDRAGEIGEEIGYTIGQYWYIVVIAALVFYFVRKRRRNPT